MPAELCAEIVSHVPPRDFRSVAALNTQFRATVTTHTRFSVVYGQSLAAERTARQLEEKDHPGTRDQLFGRALSAQQAGQPVKSDGALNPDDPFFDLAILHLAPHAPYFLPHPDSIPDHLSDHGVAPPIASSDFDKVVQNVLDSPTDDWARERNLNALRIRLPELELSNEREAAISAAYEAYQNHPPRPLHRIAKFDGGELTQDSEALGKVRKSWATTVLSLEDERHRSYAIRVVDPRSLTPEFRGKLQADAAAMLKYGGVTLGHLERHDTIPKSAQ